MADLTGRVLSVVPQWYDTVGGFCYNAAAVRSLTKRTTTRNNLDEMQRKGYDTNESIRMISHTAGTITKKYVYFVTHLLHLV